MIYKTKPSSRAMHINLQVFIITFITTVQIFQGNQLNTMNVIVSPVIGRACFALLITFYKLGSKKLITSTVAGSIPYDTHILFHCGSCSTFILGNLRNASVPLFILHVLLSLCVI